MALLIAFAALLVVLVVSFAAVGVRSVEAPVRHVLAELQDQREHLLDSLVDLDMDLAMGKLSDDDHGELRSKLEDDAIQLLAVIESRRAAEDRGSGDRTEA